MTKVLVVATSRKTRGGITSVVKAYETGEQWKKFRCRWIETHRDGNAIRKLWYLGTALIEYICLLPFYDIVHIHVATTQSARRKRLFFWLAKEFHKKTILHFHPSNEKFLFEPYNQGLYKRMFSQADLVLVLSEQWRRWIKEALGCEERIEVLYNPCPDVKRNTEIKRKQILFAGSIILRKGYDVLLEGFSKIAAKYPDWKIVFAGNGEIKQGQFMASSLGILQQTEWIGWVTGADKDKVFNESSVYCLASEGEGFPMGVLDAWAYGLPCVMTPVGGIPDIVRDGIEGVVFPVGDADALAKALDRIISNKQMRKDIVKATDKYVNETFNVRYINRQLGWIYDRLL